MVFQRAFNEEITSRATKRPDTPDYTIENPLAKDIFVHTMQFLFDGYFSARGILMVEINGVVVAKPNKVGAFRKSKTLQIPLSNQPLNRNETIKIYVWNGADNSEIKVSVSCLISESASGIAVNETPRTTKELNEEVSDNFVDAQTQFTLNKLDELKTAVEGVTVDVTTGDVTIDQSAVIEKLQAILDGLPASPDNTELQALITHLENSNDVNTDNTINLLRLIQASLPASPDNSDIIAELENLIAALPASPDNSDIIAELTEVKNAIDGIDVDVTTGEINLNQDQVIAKIQTLIDSLPASPNNADIIAELETIHNLLFTSDTNIINILHEVRDGLPASPDNADIILGLNQVIAALPSSPNNADIIAQLQVLINSLPASPDNADIVAKLNGVITELGIVDADIVEKLNGVITEIENIEISVDDISIANESIPQAIRDTLIVVDNPDTSALYRTQLTNILNALIGLQDGFDLDELNNALSIFNSNIEGINTIDDRLSISLESLFLQLRILATHPELKPSQTNFLFPRRVYRNEIQYALLNSKGNRNLIILMGASNVDIAENLDYPNPDFEPRFDFDYELLFPASIQSDINGTIYDVGEVSTTKLYESRFDFKNAGFDSNRIFNFFPSGEDIEDRLLPPEIPSVASACYLSVGNTWYSIRVETNVHYTRTFDVFESDFEDFNIETQLLNDVDKTQLAVINGSKRYVRIVENIAIRILTTGRKGQRVPNSAFVPPEDSICYSRQRQTGYDDTETTSYGNIVDSGIIGGLAKLSFEVKDSADEWYEHISSDEIGSITQGEKTLFEIGEAVSGHVLPSTQTHYRAKLQVTGGGIQTSVSIVRVA